MTVPFLHVWDTDTAIITTLLFFGALIYAAVQDIKSREVSDTIHIIITITALIGFERANLPAMLFGAAFSSLPLFIAGILKQGSIGGADIKLMATSGLILGVGKGIIALIIGLFLGVGCTLAYRKIKKADLTVSFPLVPYLAAGCFTMYLL